MIGPAAEAGRLEGEIIGGLFIDQLARFPKPNPNEKTWISDPKST